MRKRYNPLLGAKLDETVGELDDLADVSTAGTADGYVLTYGTTSGSWKPSAAGAGDMLKTDYVTGVGTVYNASRLEGETLATVQAHDVDAANITSGTLAVARHETLDNLAGTVDLEQIPTMDAAHIPVLDADKITTGTFGLERIPAVDDARIPDLETLSYGAAFGTAQVPGIGAYKVSSGTFDAARIPILPTARYGSAVLLSGAQTIGGTKTFGDIPILPASDPTADNEAARKAYVDSVAGGFSANDEISLGGFVPQIYTPQIKAGTTPLTMQCVDNSTDYEMYFGNEPTAPSGWALKGRMYAIAKATGGAPVYNGKIQLYNDTDGTQLTILQISGVNYIKYKSGLFSLPAYNKKNILKIWADEGDTINVMSVWGEFIAVKS